MRTSKFDPELKAQAVKLIEAGTPVKDIATQTGVPATTISNWKAELNKKGGRKRKPKANGASIEEELRDAEFTLTLHALENDALRKLVKESDDRKRSVIYTDYLLERLALWGDKLVKPLIETATDEE